MLVLTRKAQQKIKVGDNVVITILRVKGQAVRIGIDAPQNIRVVRAELPALPEMANVVEVAPGKPVSAERREHASFDQEVHLFESPHVESPARPLPALSKGLAERVAQRHGRTETLPQEDDTTPSRPLGFAASFALRG